MKKFYAFLMAFAIAFGASANLDAVKQNNRVKKLAKSAVNMKRAEIKSASSADGLLYDKPEGEYSVFKRDGQSLMWDWGELYLMNQDGFYAEVVMAADGVVWMRNVITYVNNDAWIKGTLSDDGTKIFVAPGTAIAHDSWNNAYLLLYPAKIDIEGAGDNALAAVVIDTEIDAITFSIDGDKITLDNTVAEQTGIAAFYDEEHANEWAGYMDMVTEYSKLDMEVATPSASAEKQAAAIVYTNPDYNEIDLTDQLGLLGEICVEGNEVFVKGLVGDYDIWIKGTVDGDKVTFANASLVGVKSAYLVYLTGASHETITNDWGFSYTQFTATGEDITYDFDAETLSLTNPSGDLLMTVEPNATSALFSYIAPAVKLYNDGARTPMAPKFTDVSFYDWGEPAYYGIALRTATFDVDGNFIDPAKIAIRFTVNGEPYTFTAAEYTCLSEDLTELPLTLTTSDYTFYWSNNYNSISIFGEQDSIRILTAQLVYYGGDTESLSAVATWEAEGSGVEENIAAESNKEAAIYNLQGVRVDRNNLTPGLYISNGKKFVVTK